MNFDFLIYNDIVPVPRFEAFRALKLLKSKKFRALKSFGQIGGFLGPDTLKIGEF